MQYLNFGIAFQMDFSRLPINYRMEYLMLEGREA